MRLLSDANFLTGLSDTFSPLPLGLSGAVTTADILWLEFNNAFKEGTAKSGVPMKIIFMAIF